tara:strand:+ start:1157 stop:2179 length:1023 start_codon:yes stop_codon:yes gene_type:complete
MSFARIGSVLILLSAVVGCLPQGSRPGARLSYTSGQSGNIGVAAAALPLADFVYPEDATLRQDRTYEVVDASGNLDRYREILWADGTGQFSLEIAGVAEDGLPSFSAPDAFWQSSYLTRQRYLVHYRDFRIHNENQVRRNYTWSELPGTTTMAGRNCSRYLAESVYSLGSVEFVMDQQSKLILGWIRRDGAGNLVCQMSTDALNETPNLSGVVWSQAIAPEQEYNGPPDDNLLGFSPNPVIYYPAGFSHGVQRIILSQVTYGSQIPNLHLEVLRDGLVNIMVAQQLEVIGGGGAFPEIIIAREAEIGGIRVMEGDVQSIRTYVIGSLPSQELLAVLGAMN